MNMKHLLRWMRGAIALFNYSVNPPTLTFVNDAGEEADIDTLESSIGPGEALEALANAASPGEGFIKVVEAGDYPHPRGLQRCPVEALEAMANSFNGLLGKFMRRFSGVPIYIGHPDDPSCAGQTGHDDLRAYGWVKEMKVMGNALWVKPKWSPAGEEILANAYYRFLSPRWTVKVGNPGFIPTHLISIGLTNTPRIKGEAIANSKTQLDNPMNPEQLAQMRKLYKLPENATADQVIAAATTAANTATETATALTNEKNLHAETEKARKTAVEALSNAELETRKQKAGVHVDKAISNGQIAPASREAEILSLANAEKFDEAAETLGKRAKVMKTAFNSLTGELGQHKGAGIPGDAETASSEYLNLVNSLIDTKGQSYEFAWGNARMTTPGKEIWERMHKKQEGTAG